MSSRLLPHLPAPRRLLRPAAAGLTLALFGCAVGPNYHRPAVVTPAAFKEGEGWKVAAPSDAVQRGAWWEVFQDPVLNGLEAQVAASNLTLAQDEANYEDARQIARAERASFFPFLTADGSVQRTRTPGRAATVIGNPTASQGTAYSASLQTSWQPDFWGQVRRETESDVRAAQASAATLANARLSVQSELATDYIALRASDELARLLRDAVDAYNRTLTITKNKYGVGVSALSDILSAEAQLDATRAQMVQAGVERANYEHAIAVLLGLPPASFSLAPRPRLDLPVPAVPGVLPSDLLERRPDIAEAERSVAEFNARIGVQTAAFFPTISLSAQGGYDSSIWHQLFIYPNRFWSIGASAAEDLWTWGQHRAELMQAKAEYNGSVANYRQTVLTAFQQVEDNLSALRLLSQEASIQQAAVSEAAQATKITLNEYLAGTVDYTTVVTAEVAELNDREQALNTQSSRLSDSVGLIVALGGGWQQSDLPSWHQVMVRKSQAPAAVAAPAGS